MSESIGKIKELVAELEELDIDIKTLQDNLEKIRDFIATNPTEEQAREHIEIFEVEKGLKHIVLY